MTDGVYGIDLGTTYSVIARINDLGQAEQLLNNDSLPTTPSVVYFEGDSDVIVGAEAKRLQLRDPDNACSLIKRHMGTDYPLDFRGQKHTPESISALILKELVAFANAETGEEVSKVVITVPAYFGIQEREATKQAGKIAGLEVVGIVTEPVAAALSLRIGGEQPETLLVYDLGGGTFDTTVIRAEAGKIEVIAIDGNKALGGADWDEALAQLIAGEFIAQAGLGDDDPRVDAEFEAELMGLAEDTKKALTKREQATVRCRYGDKDEQVTVTRARFEDATRHLVSQTIEISQRVLATAEQKVPGLTVDRVLLVGGSSNMPMIENALQNELGRTPAKTQFDLAVAKGAAIYGQAAIDEVISTDGEAPAVAADAEEKYYLGGSKTLQLTNALSRGLGVEFVHEGTEDKYVGFIMHANDTIPAVSPTITARTVANRQTAVNVVLYEQIGEVESDATSDNKHLKDSELPIPSLPKGSPIELTLEVTSEGLARVTAHDPAGGKSITVEAKVSILSEEDVDQAAGVVAGISLRS
ncbi:Hsp70 family protein [Frankia sp. AgB1.9]|uniref:Hsp70 family protein n=1 Tax=unclassified Frankia TaxID=2632575 RepID=UPI001933115C|nr:MULTISPECIES: Hsp70 family protein [unclassified Frankia]MBL7489631.1 Hsp70 family protein [Frankia sp. AgW1.1]MBL7547338.1 Hsp70 family protein [Frankia sp. AgB1.9]MBL7618737.1 Hsp70 family protein [Frankia sp. AgB1.8]